MAKQTKTQQAHRAETIESLKKMLPPGTVVFTILKHTSRSGMMRYIRVVYEDKVHGITDISHQVAEAICFSMEPGEFTPGIKVRGCGMDMGFHVVYYLSSALYSKGFTCLGEGDGSYGSRCPSNDHFNGDRDYTPHHHAAGGYALRHRWL